MPTTVGILTFMNMINFMLNKDEHQTLFDFDYFDIYEQYKFHAQLS